MSCEPQIKEFPNRRKRILVCPFKFNRIDNDKECIKGNCALWLPIQRACSIQVLARGYTPKREYE